MTKKTSNFNQALWLSVGQIGNYVVAFLSAAILSRYLSKEEYGTYRQILYVYTTMMSLFTIGLPSVFSYFIPRLNTSQQKTLINTLNRLFILLGALFSISLYFLSTPISIWLKNPELSIGLKIFSVFPLFTLPSLGVEGIYTALRKTKFTALYQLFSRIMMLIFIVTPVVFIRPDYKLAVIGWGVASFATFALAMYMKTKPYRNIKSERVPKLYKTVFDYSIPLMGAFIAGFFISAADQFYISRFYGTEAFADYSNGMLSIPIVLLVTIPIKNVLLPLFSKADSLGNLAPAIKSYTNAVNKSIVLAFPLLVYSVFFAKEILVFVYGERYSVSESYMRFYLIRDFLSVLPYFSVFLALGMSKIYLYMHIVGAIYVWIFGLLVVSLKLPPSFIVLVRSMFYFSSTVYAFYYIYKRNKINLFPKEILNKIISVTLHSILILLPMYYLVRYYFILEWPSIFILALTVVLFYVLLVITGRIIRTNYLEVFIILFKKYKK